MKADTHPQKTGAEAALAAIYANAKTRLPGDQSVVALREAAFCEFGALGLPSWRLEQWHYTDLRGRLLDAKPLAASPNDAAKIWAKQAGKLAGDIDALRIVFVDGVFVAELSDLDKVPPGLTIRPMAQALVSGDPLVAKYLGKLSVTEHESVTALNTALMQDGALIHVAAAAAVERPIHLVFAASAEIPVSIFTRSLAVVEAGARVMIVESHEASAGHQINTALEMSVGEGAHVDHIKITAGPGDLVHLSSLMAVVGARARLNDFCFNLGGGLLRNQLFVRFTGEGAVANLRGASLARGKQHVDTTLVAIHEAQGCQSREFYASVLDGESRGVFQGKIIVRPQAQRTDAKMMTRSLLLSENAEANSKPELEIFADDVQCGHGATSGALDDELKFYLMARGIPRVEAETLLVQAFVGESIDGIEDAGLRDALMDQVVAWLRARKD